MTSLMISATLARRRSRSRVSLVTVLTSSKKSSKSARSVKRTDPLRMVGINGSILSIWTGGFGESVSLKRFGQNCGSGTGADSICASCHHIFQSLQCADASRGFYAQRVSYDLAHQLNILGACTAG